MRRSRRRSDRQNHFHFHQRAASTEVLAELEGDCLEKRGVPLAYWHGGITNCITPPVIQRNILENPGWYTQYTPYEARRSAKDGLRRC